MYRILVHVRVTRWPSVVVFNFFWIMDDVFCRFGNFFLFHLWCSVLVHLFKIISPPPPPPPPPYWYVAAIEIWGNAIALLFKLSIHRMKQDMDEHNSQMLSTENYYEKQHESQPKKNKEGQHLWKKTLDKAFHTQKERRLCSKCNWSNFYFVCLILL